jgi:hypothetical protein
MFTELTELTVKEKYQADHHCTLLLACNGRVEVELRWSTHALRKVAHFSWFAD